MISLTTEITVAQLFLKAEPIAGHLVTAMVASVRQHAAE